MPLSEDEQRILHEIEEQFYEQDPAFARGVSSITRPAARDLKLSGLGFVIGVIVLVTTFTSSAVLAVAGFGIMLASAFWFERSLRKLGRVGINSLSDAVRGKGLGDRFGGGAARFRQRFQRDESD